MQIQLPPVRQVLCGVPNLELMKNFSTGSLRAPPDLNRMTASELLNKIKPLFPSLRKHFDCTVFVLKEEGDEIYQESWNTQSASAGNPNIPDLEISKPAFAGSVFTEVLFCVSKMLKLPDIQMDMQLLLDLLKAFQPTEASEVIATLESVVSFCKVICWSIARKRQQKYKFSACPESSSSLCCELGSCAPKLLIGMMKIFRMVQRASFLRSGACPSI
ncbi:hypothetical protein MKX01_014140 [Papaver californicum]|nr:hypothetical protein MKX01_014140 [Papaver californicum]